MARDLTIQQVASLTGLSEHTLRYYERAGLLAPIGRAENGHRRYAEADLAWIAFLNRLRATGMPIRQMKQFADLRRQGDATVTARRMLLQAHEQAVQAHVQELQRNLDAIVVKIGQYQQWEAEHDGDNSLCARTAESGPDQR